jgi:hypothetical protein
MACIYSCPSFILRLILTFIPSLAAVLICYFIPNIQSTIVTLSILAVLLSIDIPTLIFTFIKKLQVAEKFHQYHNYNRGSRRYLLLRDAILLGTFVLVTGISSGLIGYYRNTFDKDSAVNLIGIVLVAMAVLVKILYASQEAFVVFGIFKNPLVYWISSIKNANRTLSFIRYLFDKTGK